MIFCFFTQLSNYLFEQDEKYCIRLLDSDKSEKIAHAYTEIDEIIRKSNPEITKDGEKNNF